MKKILITGATGFVGKNLTQFLIEKKKYEVLPYGSNGFDLRDKRDVRQLLVYNKPDIVIHLAAVCGGIGANRENPVKFFMDNEKINLNILESCHDFKVSKLVTLGSVCSYGVNPPNIPFREEDIWSGYPEPTNAPYGISKRNLMLGCQIYNQQFGDNFIHLVPTNMMGIEDNFDDKSSHVIPALIKKMHMAKVMNKEEVVVWGNPDSGTSREFLYVEDCCRAIEMAMLKYNKPDPVNIGTGSEIKIVDLVELIKKVVDYKGKIVYDRSKPDGQPRRCLDTTRAEKEFGFRAEVSLEEGLKRMYEWYIDTI